MKKFSYILLGLFLSVTLFMSCDDLLDANSKRLTTDSEYGLTSGSDSIYSLFGVLSQLQKLGDSYVLLGELRADLMDVTPSSDMYLRQISDNAVTPDNKYVNIKDYYTVINNCNYILKHLDTLELDRTQKIKLRHYAAISGIRAWTMMQVALNFGKIKYYTDPILTVSDAKKVYPEYTFQQLTEILIPELEKIKEVELPDPGFLDSYEVKFSFFPIKFLLGDLYLWRGAEGDYEKAATMYYDLMYKRNIVVNKANTSAWTTVNNAITSTGVLNWQKAFTFSSKEIITTITCPTDYGQKFLLDTLNNQHLITASSVALSNWDNQTYYQSEASSATGDLRKYGSISYNSATNKEITTDFDFSGVKSTDFLIYKYKMYDQNIIVYRSSLLYLRYAEALNRLNKPKIAFAVLKCGLNSSNMLNENLVPMKEKGNPAPKYLNFNDSRFTDNVGIRMRGLGKMNEDTTFFRIPHLNALVDSVLYVENKIQEELALETAFEGNRFHDLMRIAIRRNDPSYLANIIAEKHGANKNAVKAKLLDMTNWYIKTE